MQGTGEAVGEDDLWRAEEKRVEHTESWATLVCKGQMEKEKLMKDMLKEGSERDEQNQKKIQCPRRERRRKFQERDIGVC